MKRCSTSRISKLKQQLATTTHQLEWPKSRPLIVPNSGKVVEQQESSLLLGMQHGTAVLEASLTVFTKLNIFLPYDPETYTQMFMAALFMIVKTWKMSFSW